MEAETEELFLTTVHKLGLDLSRAARAKHADYMFPLMSALNDCTIYLKYGQPIPFMDDLLTFVSHNRQAQTYEALNSFVKEILPVGPGTPKEIYQYLSTHPDIAVYFARIRQYAENDEMMTAFKRVRDKHLFHYDARDKHAKETLKVLAHFATLDENLGGDVHITFAKENNHYDCADLWTWVAWHVLHGQINSARMSELTMEDWEISAEYFEKFKHFFADALLEFNLFGKVAVSSWLKDNHLVIREQIVEAETVDTLFQAFVDDLNSKCWPG